MTDVLVAGIAVADFVMQVDDLPAAAEKYRASEAMVTVGGCAANSAIAVARQGGRARLVTRVGDDPVGRIILEDLAREGVDTSLTHRAPGGISSFSSIAVDRWGERQIVNFRGRGLTKSTEWLRNVGKPQAVLTDTRWPPLTERVLEIAKGLGVPGVVDAEPPIEVDTIRAATHIAFSAPGLGGYAPGLSLPDALDQARQDFGIWVCVTDGPRGVWFMDGPSIEHIEAFEVETADTLGAGDVWHGAFALRLAEGATEVEAVIFANAAAALKCRAFGGVTACPDRAATEAFLKERMTCS